ncbi:Clp protease N-terminal domain-containing protein, partial [Wenyingzhuangia sp. 2_MG-2023]|uniref:Clp protease N-terminal domain-containing protein n=1 Tax=Wenyingzhuangia sp. 2_MG-2023 TaxID=3062639 RepID=UPI0026E2BB50
MDDEYVYIEHLLIALLKNKDTVSLLLKDQGVTEKGLKAAIVEIRKGQIVS